MISSTGNSANHSYSTEKMGTEQCDLYEKTAQVGSECCLDNEQRMLGSVLTNSVIDENSNQVSVNLTENSVIQLPELPHP